MESGITRGGAPAKGIWRRPGRKLLAAAAAAAAIMAIGVPAASADSGPAIIIPVDPPGLVTTIANDIAGPMCMDDWGDSSTNFNKVAINDCNGTAEQLWDYVVPGNTIQINGLCLDVYAGGTTDGTPVDVYACNSTGAQVWIWESDGAFYNPQSGKCLDDTGWSTTPGTQLDIWDCSGLAVQQWGGVGEHILDH
jgi:hypothetical protein